MICYYIHVRQTKLKIEGKETAKREEAISTIIAIADALGEDFIYIASKKRYVDVEELNKLRTETLVSFANRARKNLEGEY